MTAAADAWPVVRRPGTLTAAVVCMLVMIAAGLAISVAFVVLPDPDELPTGVAVGVTVATLVLSVLYAALAALVLHGRQWARITTWAVSGVLLLFCALGLVVYTTVNVAVGGWVDPRLVAFGAFFVLHASVIVLLALPPTNRYVRARRQPR